MQLHTHDSLESKLRSQQHRASHPRTQIYKRRLPHRRCWPALAPTPHQRLQHRRRHPVVSRCVPVMPVPALQVPARNQSAGIHAKFNIERVPRETILHRKPRQQSPCRLVLFPLCSFHGLNLTIDRRACQPSSCSTSWRASNVCPPSSPPTCQFPRSGC